MSTGQANAKQPSAADAAFETRDFYLACFLRCTGYELVEPARRRPAQGVRLPRSRRRGATT